MEPFIFPESDWDMLEQMSADIQSFLPHPTIDVDHTDDWRRAMGYADWLANGNANIREWLRTDCLDIIWPAFFDSVQDVERAESMGAIPYTPPAE